MNFAVRRILMGTGWSQRLYIALRRAYKIRSISGAARKYFLNYDDFRAALDIEGRSDPFDLRTADGLTITTGKNYGEALTVAQTFLQDCYTTHMRMPAEPVIVDVGGFVADYAIFAVKRLNARRVIVCEPSPLNWERLIKNIVANGCQDRIEPLQKAVTDGRDVMMDIDSPDQSLVSSHFPTNRGLVRVPGISLAQLNEEYKLEKVDLLKIDCEGAEYSILESTPSDVYRRIANVVFEFHEIPEGAGKLESVKRRLEKEGYTLHTDGELVSATRG